jgi:single-strand DNA-binding protein
MGKLNNYCCEGNLVTDPVLKIPANIEKAICSMRIAINTAYKSKDSNDTIFMRVVAFGKLAEVCAEYLKKGQPVIVTGRLKPNNWTTKEGEKRNEIELHASDISFQGKKTGVLEPKPEESLVEEDNTHDDIPF